MPATAQPPLPLEWFAPHDHGAGTTPHQHFEHQRHGEDHDGVRVVPFDPPAGASTATPEQQEVLRLRAQNKALHDEILALGARPDVNSVLYVRMEALADLLLPDPAARLRFEVAFERRMTAILNQMLTSARQAHLTGGTAPPPGASGLLLPKGVSR